MAKDLSFSTFLDEYDADFFDYDIVKISWHIFLKDTTDYAATSKAS